MEEIKDLLLDIERSRKNLRLYPSNNPVYLATIDRIYTKLNSYLDINDELTLKLKQYDIIFNEENVYYNKNRDESLALLLFKDGIRELTFIKGIPRDEVGDFLKILSTDFQAEIPEEDIVTLMWEREFQLILYVVDNDFLLEDENYETTAVEYVKHHSAGKDEIMSAYKDTVNLAEVSHRDAAPFTEEDRMNILRDLEISSKERLPKMVSLLFEMLFLAHNKNDYDSIANIFVMFINYSMKHKNLTDMRDIVRKLKNGIDGSVYGQEVNPFLQGALDVINTGEFIKLFGCAVEEKSKWGNDVLLELAGFFSRDAIPHLVEILGETKNNSAEKILTHILSELGREDIPVLAHYLNDSRWNLVRNILHILRQIGDRSALEFIENVAGHPDKQVKIEALNALGAMGTDKNLTAIAHRLNDPDIMVSLASISAIGTIGTPAAKQIIIDEIGSKNFAGRSYREKRDLFITLSKWKDDDVIDLALRTLNKKTFFKKAKNTESRAAAAYALGVMGVKEALDPLLKLQQSKNTLLRKNVLGAIKKIKNE
ncbi:MAG: HEAT repeat domain-containing protein [Nitrospiraceae bacterium]|nr:MAG: HEAT repeat domain-containing protein [Nitrospiraceae bacterium]